MDVARKFDMPVYDSGFVFKTALKEAFLGPVPSLAYAFRSEKSESYRCQKEVVKLEKEIKCFENSKNRPYNYTKLREKKYIALIDALKLEKRGAACYTVAFAVSLLLKPLFIFLLSMGFLLPISFRMSDSDKEANFFPLSVSVSLPKIALLVISCVGVVFGLIAAVYNLIAATCKIKKSEEILASLKKKLR